MPTEAIQQQRESCSVRKQTFDYHSFRRQSISEDLHEDEEVILDSELVTEIPVPDKDIYL